MGRRRHRAIALVLTISGVYGVLAYAVARRTKEIGIRMALGESTAGVVGLVLKQSMRLCAIGLCIGLSLAVALSTALASTLVMMDTFDLAAFAAGIVVIAACLAAAFYPRAERGAGGTVGGAENRIARRVPDFGLAQLHPAHCRGRRNDTELVPRNGLTIARTSRSPAGPDMLTLRSWFRGVRLTVRNVRRARSFYVSTVLVLALGMAGATLMFTLIRGIVLRPLPVPDEDRLVVSWLVPRTGLPTHIPYRSADVEEFDRSSRSFAHVTGVGYNGAMDETWSDGSRSFTASTVAVMGGFFDVADVTPQLGRRLRREDDRSGAERLVVLSHGVWRRVFAGSSTVIGRTLRLKRHTFTVAGVMPADFEYPSGAEIWTTRHALAGIEPNEAFRTGLLRDVEILARMREGVQIDQAREELAAMTTQLAMRRGAEGVEGFHPVLRSFKDAIVGDMDSVLVVLFAAVGLILAIATANVANLFLVRGEHRRSEFAVRTALGASRASLVAQVLIESLAIAMVATTAGLAMARWVLPLVVLFVPDGLPRPESIYIDADVLAFAAVVGVASATLAGIVPGLLASRLDLVSCLRAGGRGVAGSASARRRRVLVAAQVALAVTVVAAAGLLARSLQRLQTADMGLRTEHLVLAELDLPSADYRDPVRRRRFFDDVLTRLRAASGIDAVSPINALPFAGPGGWDVPRFTGEGQTADQITSNPALNFEVVHPDYFATLGVAIVRGRGFTTADRDGASPVAIVSDAVAAHAWPHAEVVGKRIKLGGTSSQEPWLRVVGVAATTRYRELATPRPTLYLPADQFMFTFGRLAIRTAAHPSAVTRLVRDAVESADPAVRVERVAPYTQYLRGPLAWPRFYAVLLGVFAVTALLLAAVGLYGVMAASVRQRHREIGVRLALGATATHVRQLVVREGLALVTAGMVVGLALALATNRTLRSLLYEIDPLDPISLAGASVLLVAAALAAAWLPARHATRVDPIDVLRAE